MAGVVHFANFFKWMEETEHEFLRSIGVSLSPTSTSRTPAVYWPRVSATCDYSHPARFEDEVACHLKIQRVGDGSITHRVEFMVNAVTIATGSMTIACCTLENGTLRPLPIPPEIRARLSVLH